MIRKIVSFIILVPLAALIVVFAVANRAPVTIALDPLAGEPPLISASVPLFLVVLATLIVGVIIGGVASWSRQGRWRRATRRLEAKVKAQHAEIDTLKRQVAASAAAPQSSSIAAIAYRHPSAA